MTASKFAIILLPGLTVIPVSQAQIKHIEMRVEGMTWNFWAYGVQQHLGRQSGVQKIEVSLLTRKVEITPKEDGRIDPAQLMKATYDSGVTVAEMDLIVKGRVVKDPSSGFALEAGLGEVFPITPNDISREIEPLAGSPTEVTVNGQLYKKPASKSKQKSEGPLKLLILEIQKKE
jgi:cation transport ATPase